MNSATVVHVVTAAVMDAEVSEFAEETFASLATIPLDVFSFALLSRMSFALWNTSTCVCTCFSNLAVAVIMTFKIHIVSSSKMTVKAYCDAKFSTMYVSSLLFWKSSHMQHLSCHLNLKLHGDNPTLGQHTASYFTGIYKNVQGRIPAYLPGRPGQQVTGALLGLGCHQLPSKQHLACLAIPLAASYI